ncbi:transposase, MuDR, MULE transposase domain protein [Tanacetum coccineum]
MTFTMGSIFYHGVNLLAVGMDGNNQTLPIAFGICQGEDGDGWTWFLEELKAYISQKPKLSIISDTHPAILESSAIPTAYAKLVKAGFTRWSRAHFPANCYNYLTSNSAESVNSLSRRACKLPVTHLMEFFRALLQRWYYERRYEGDVDEHELTPWAAAKVAYRIRISFVFSVHGINSTTYQVVAKEISYTVDLRSRTCTCRRWKLSGLPAIRAVESCLGSCGIANLAILQLGKFSGGGGRGLTMVELGLQDKTGVANP